MERLISAVTESFAFLQPYPYLTALIVIAVFLVLAKLVDIIFSRTIARIVGRTPASTIILSLCCTGRFS